LDSSCWPTTGAQHGKTRLSAEVPPQGPERGRGRKPIAEVAKAFGIRAQSISTWRRRARIDKGLLAARTGHAHNELVAARRRITQLETELAVTRPASELLRMRRPLSTVRGDPGDGHPRIPHTGLLPSAGGLAVRLLRRADAAAIGTGDPPRLAHRRPCRHPPATWRGCAAGRADRATPGRPVGSRRASSGLGDPCGPSPSECHLPGFPPRGDNSERRVPWWPASRGRVAGSRRAAIPDWRIQ
jgi:transposase